MAEDDTRSLLRKILSPAEAQSLVQAFTEPTPRPSACSGLAGYFAAAPLASRNVDVKPETGYLKISSSGQVGYLPKANLRAARHIDPNLEVLDEVEARPSGRASDG